MLKNPENLHTTQGRDMRDITGAVWWSPSQVNDDISSSGEHIRCVHGELHLGSDLKPSSAMPHFRIEVSMQLRSNLDLTDHDFASIPSYSIPLPPSDSKLVKARSFFKSRKSKLSPRLLLARVLCGLHLRDTKGTSLVEVLWKEVLVFCRVLDSFNINLNPHCLLFLLGSCPIYIITYHDVNETTFTTIIFMPCTKCGMVKCIILLLEHICR